MSAASEYYAYVPSLSHFVYYLKDNVCSESATSCKDAAQTLLSAASLDIDYDAISHAVVLNALWPDAGPSGWKETISLRAEEEVIEVGVLTHEPNSDPEDLGFGGFLTLLGQDDTPSTSSLPLPFPLPLLYSHIY